MLRIEGNKQYAVQVAKPFEMKHKDTERYKDIHSND